MKGPKLKFTRKERKNMAKQAQSLEDRLNISEMQLDAKVAEARTFTDNYEQTVRDYLTKEGLDDKVVPVRMTLPIQHPVEDRTVELLNIAFVDEETMTRCQEERLITGEQEDMLNSFGERYVQRIEPMLSEMDCRAEECDQAYFGLSDLTMVISPFRQKEGKDKLILYAEDPAERNVLKVTADLRECVIKEEQRLEIYSDAASVLKTKDTLEVMQEEAQEKDANVYVLEHPLPGFPRQAMAGKVLAQMQEQYDKNNPEAAAERMPDDPLLRMLQDEGVQLVVMDGGEPLDENGILLEDYYRERCTGCPSQDECEHYSKAKAFYEKGDDEPVN